MAIATYVSASGGRQRQISRHSDASAANTALTLTSPIGAQRALVFVTVKYSAAPTQTGVTVELVSGVSAAYDTTLDTGTANTQNYKFLPTQGAVAFTDTDAIRVTAPAAGGAITSQITIFTEFIG